MLAVLEVISMKVALIQISDIHLATKRDYDRIIYQIDLIFLMMQFLMM